METILSLIVKIFSVFQSLFNIQEKFKKPKISLSIKSLEYTLIKNDPFSSVFILSPNPSRFESEIEISNIGSKSTTIKDISLKIWPFKLKSGEFKPFKIEPGDTSILSLFFPIDEKHAQEKGEFELILQETYGKEYKISGNFPVKTLESNK